MLLSCFSAACAFALRPVAPADLASLPASCCPGCNLAGKAVAAPTPPVMGGMMVVVVEPDMTMQLGKQEEADSSRLPSSEAAAAGGAEELPALQASRGQDSTSR